MIDTLKLIHSTFAQLLAEDESKLTVQNISERAGISRNTFYYYYESIEPLAAKVLGDWLDGGSAPAENLHDCLVPVIERCLAHRTEIMRLCRSSYRHVLMSRLHTLLAERLTKFLHARLSGLQPLEISEELELNDHILTGFLTHWLEKNMSYDLRRYTSRLDTDFARLYPPREQ